MCYRLWYNAPNTLSAGSLEAEAEPPLPDYRLAVYWVHYTTICNTQSSAPEDGQNNCPKHVELIGIINKPLLLHLVDCLYYLYIYLRGVYNTKFCETCRNINIDTQARVCS